MKEMKKVLGKDKSEDRESKAKYEMLKALRKEAMNMMGDDISDEMGDMQKVTVAAPDEESLMEGLETAEDLLKDKMPMMAEGDMEESDLEDEGEMSEEEMLEAELALLEEDEEDEEEEA